MSTVTVELNNKVKYDSYFDYRLKTAEVNQIRKMNNDVFVCYKSEETGVISSMISISKLNSIPFQLLYTCNGEALMAINKKYKNKINLEKYEKEYIKLLIDKTI